MVKTKNDDVPNPKFPPDECYEPQHKGQSHLWILNDGRPNPPWISDNHDNFRQPVVTPILKGARATMEYQKILQEVMEEIKAEQNPPEEPTEYCSEYSGNFGGNIDIAKPDDKELDDLKQKYPLYETPIMTVYRQNYLAQPVNTPNIIKRNPQGECLWRKNNFFTTPIDLLTREPPEGL